MADGSWVFMVPVRELHLTEAVGRQFRVDRVTFVHRDKLPRVRRRLGIGATVAEVKKTIPGWDFFESGHAFAVVRESGEPEKVKQRCLRIIRDELSILSLSQLGYSKRKNMGPVAPSGELTHSYIGFLVVSSRDKTRFGNLFERTAPNYQLVLDGRWKRRQDNVFFTKLLKILRRETPVEAGWCRELCRASVMIGESVAANDLLKSFVWNMVALEMLLTKQQERARYTLPRRAEALLGWVLYWEAENYEDRIKQVYDKRNALLHGGHRHRITAQDLAFTDHLLENLLANLVSFPKLFHSKDALVEFSKKVEAERILQR